MSTFITQLDAKGNGPRVAVKDIIDVVDVPTTAGCRAIANTAKPAEADAPCLAGIRAADARIVGKANLHELAMLPIGTNPWFGSPVNPLDAALIPGGSSSGSAVAVANDDADVALGSDTGGSVRIPSACCGTAGLKTTHGRVSLAGVYPLAPSLDTIGPMGRDIAGVALGMQLLEPGFTPAPDAARVIGRFRTSGDPAIEAAIDDALARAEFEVVTLDAAILDAGSELFTAIYFAEMFDVDGKLVADNPADVGADIIQTVGLADLFRGGIDDARASLDAWQRELFALFDRVELFALPTLPVFPPRLDALTEAAFMNLVIEITKHVSVFNAAGVPCTAQPVPVAGAALPASLQLVGPRGAEELLLPTAARVEAALN
jgi:amidase